MGARKNSTNNPVLGALVVAAIVGGLAGSWAVFEIVAFGLVAFVIVTSVYGAIRPKGKASVGTGNRRYGRQ